MQFYTIVKNYDLAIQMKELIDNLTETENYNLPESSKLPPKEYSCANKITKIVEPICIFEKFEEKISEKNHELLDKIDKVYENLSFKFNQILCKKLNEFNEIFKAKNMTEKSESNYSWCKSGDSEDISDNVSVNSINNDFMKILDELSEIESVSAVSFSFEDTNLKHSYSFNEITSFSFEIEFQENK